MRQFRIRLNHFERVAGLFVLVAILGGLLTVVTAAIKQGWFSEKVEFITYFENADGLHQGTKVQMAGLQAGAVEDVDLEGDNKIRVKFHVLGKFRDKVREDSKAQLIRPFVIGERTLEVSVGSPSEKVLAPGALVASEESLDLMQAMSGKHLGKYMKETGEMLNNLKTVMEAFLSQDRTQKMVQIFDQLSPLIQNMNVMSVEVTKLSKQATDSDNMRAMMKNVVVLTHELNKTLPEISAAMKEIGPEMPKTARRAVEALDEATILIKALQKSLLLRSSVKEVRDEENDQQRLPASRTKVGP
jgi:phospholipid/cholesterol/gamma-HCH transport system substrate-binding protein